MWEGLSRPEDSLFLVDKFPGTEDERVVHLIEEGRVLVERMRALGVRDSDVGKAAYHIDKAVRAGIEGLRWVG